MELTRSERWILSNQYRMLEKLFPDDADHYAEARNILERGYEYDYDRLAVHIYDERNATTEEESTEVIEILAMFDSLKQSYNKLSDNADITEGTIQFSGFDGNNEGKQMAYARFFCERDGGRFTNLERGDNFNSHLPMLARYRRMLAEWKKIDPTRHFQLSKAEILSITG